MVSVIESEKLGNALNMLEALNTIMLEGDDKNIFVFGKIQKVIEFMDEVIC